MKEPVDLGDVFVMSECLCIVSWAIVKIKLLLDLK